MRVNFYATLRDIIGGSHLVLDLPPGCTAQQLFDLLIAQHPDLGPALLDENKRLRRHLKMFINGREVAYLEGQFEYVVQPADVVDIFPPVGGG